MSLLRRAKDVSGDLAAASVRQAQRGKLELEIRRLQSKVRSEKGAIGSALYPALESGALKIDLPEVLEHMTVIANLLGVISEKKAELEALNRPGAKGGDADVAESMENVDANATGEASVQESLKMKVAEQEGKPVDIGGEG